MRRIVDEQELISEIQDSVHDLVNFVKDQVKLGLTGNGDADTTERGIFRQLLQVGLKLMCLYFAGLGDGDVGKNVQIDGVEYERGGRSPASLLTVFGVVHFKRFLYYRVDGVKEKSLKLLDCWVTLPSCQASYFVTDWLSRLGVKYTVYEESVRFFRDMFGLSISKRTAEEAVAGLEVGYDAYEQKLQVVNADEEGELCVI